MKRALLWTFLVAGCGKIDHDATPATTPIAPPEPQAQLTAEELPVAEDFVPEAAEQITTASYVAELDALQREIDADK